MVIAALAVIVLDLVRANALDSCQNQNWVIFLTVAFFSRKDPGSGTSETWAIQGMGPPLKGPYPLPGTRKFWQLTGSAAVV